MPSRGVFRGVSSVLFDDPDYQRLSTAARCLLMTLRLCRDAGPAVIFEYSTDKLSRQTGLGVRALETAFQALEAGTWISRQPPIVWVRNGLRYDPLLTLANPKHVKSILRSISILPASPILASFCQYYRLPYPFERVADTLCQSGSREKGVGSREKGVGTTDLHAVEISEHVETGTRPGHPTPEVARAPSDSNRPTRPRPSKGRFADLVAALCREYPDLPPDQIERLATKHYYDP